MDNGDQQFHKVFLEFLFEQLYINFPLVKVAY